jgi:hypothetical protein
MLKHTVPLCRSHCHRSSRTVPRPGGDGHLLGCSNEVYFLIIKSLANIFEVLHNFPCSDMLNDPRRRARVDPRLNGFGRRALEGIKLALGGRARDVTSLAAVAGARSFVTD